MKILVDILLDTNNRKIIIKEFQNNIWNNREVLPDNRINEILSTLAYDLDFYEPDEMLRKESSSYYGDEYLEQELIRVIQKIEEYKNL